MVRNNPCFTCKQRRRKCVREQNSKSCKRCADKNLKCNPYNNKIPFFTGDLDIVSAEAVISLYKELRYLESQIQLLDIEMKEQKALVKKEPQWKINVVNGRFQLASTIKTFEEFILYGQSAIRYLSPFGNTFQTACFEFESSYPSLTNTSMQAVAKFHVEKSSSIKLELWPVSSKQPYDVYRQLVENYFHCFNDTIPILHEPSYRAHFKRLENPLRDPVTAAICASSAILNCKHAILNSTEKRYFGEYFYQQTTSMLMDIFDDPDKAFESLLAINVLQMFLMTTLRLQEGRKWGAIALVLCHNLSQEMADFKNRGSELPRNARVKGALLHRNYAVSRCYSDVLNSIIENTASGSHYSQHVAFDILPDESLKVKNILEMINYIQTLSLHPVFITVANQKKILSMGGKASLGFEEIIRYEELVLEWWHTLPEKFKICPEPFNLTSGIIDRTTDTTKLMIASYFHSFTLGIQAVLVQPKPNRKIDSLSHVIKERAIHFAMNSADLFLKLSRRMEALDDYCYSPSKLLIRSIDSLMAVIHLDGPIKDKVEAKINEYMYDFRRTVSPDDQVALSKSRVAILSNVSPENMPSLNELYKDFSLPGEALLFDIVQTTVEQAKASARSSK